MVYFGWSIDAVGGQRLATSDVPNLWQQLA